MNSDDLERLRHQVALAAEGFAKVQQAFQERIIAQLQPAFEAQRRMAAAFGSAFRQAEETQRRFAEVMAPVVRQFQQMQVEEKKGSGVFSEQR